MKPNIILIMCDTLRCDALSCMGNIPDLTPNIDKLAKEGVLYNQAHSASPVCSPARCSMLHGVYPQVHMAFENGIPRKTDLPAFTDLLKEQGYYNMIIGKAHYGISTQKIPESYDVAFITNSEKFADSDDYFGQVLHSQGYTRDVKFPFDRDEKYTVDYAITTKAIEEIDKASKRNQPFFALCSLLSPHRPIDPTMKYQNSVNPDTVPSLNYVEGEEDNLPVLVKDMVNYKKDFDEEFAKKGYPYENNRQKYFELVKYCDAQVGRLIGFLKEKNLYENSLIIFTSDHGQELGDHGFNDKHNFYDETWRVPLIMRMPDKIQPGTVCTFASTVDVTATILGAAGTSCDTMSGFNLLEHLSKNKPSPRKCATGTLCRFCAIVTEDYKLEYYFDDINGRMYDRKKDPMERHDIYNDEKYSLQKYKLLEALLGWYGATEDLSYYKKNMTVKKKLAKKYNFYLNDLKANDIEVNLQKLIEKYKHNI